MKSIATRSVALVVGLSNKIILLMLCKSTIDFLVLNLGIAILYRHTHFDVIPSHLLSKLHFSDTFSVTIPAASFRQASKGFVFKILAKKTMHPTLMSGYHRDSIKAPLTQVSSFLFPLCYRFSFFSFSPRLSILSDNGGSSA